MASGGTSAGGRGGGWRQYAILAVLVGGLELIAVGAWYVLRGVELHESGVRLAGYVAAAAVLGVVLWFAGYRTRPAPDPAMREPVVDSTVWMWRAAMRRVDRMDPRRFAGHVAGLCEREGFTEVEVGRPGADGREVDVTARDASGRAVVLRCRAVGAEGEVSGAVVSRFVADAEAEPAVRALVTRAAGFTVKARSVAEEQGVALIARKALAVWEVSGELPEPLAE